MTWLEDFLTSTSRSSVSATLTNSSQILLCYCTFSLCDRSNSICLAGANTNKSNYTWTSNASSSMSFDFKGQVPIFHYEHLSLVRY